MCMLMMENLAISINPLIPLIFLNHHEAQGKTCNENPNETKDCSDEPECDCDICVWGHHIFDWIENKSNYHSPCPQWKNQRREFSFPMSKSKVIWYEDPNGSGYIYRDDIDVMDRMDANRRKLYWDTIGSMKSLGGSHKPFLCNTADNPTDGTNTTLRRAL